MDLANFALRLEIVLIFASRYSQLCLSFLRTFMIQKTNRCTHLESTLFTFMQTTPHEGVHASLSCRHDLYAHVFRFHFHLL